MSCHPLDCWRSFRAIRSLRRLRSIRDADGRGPPRPFAEFLRQRRWRRSYEVVDDDDDEGPDTATTTTSPSSSFARWFVKTTIWFACGLVVASTFLYAVVDRSSDLFVCIPVIVVASLAVAFSAQVRYVALLALLHVCSGKGQIVFLAYVFIVATDGPLRNALFNLQVLMNGTVCLQNKMADLLPPFVADHLRAHPDRRSESRGAFEDGRALLNDTLTAFRSAFVAMESLFNKTLRRLDKEHGRLTDKRSLCRKLETKLNYAIDAFAGRLFGSWRVVAFTPWLPTTVQHTAKGIVRRGFQSACGYGDSDAYDFFGLKTLLRNRMRAVRDYVTLESDVDVHFDRRFSFVVNQSRSFGSVKTAIVNDVSNAFGWMKKALNLVSLTLGSTTIMVIVKAMLYRRKYRRSPKFDNYYLSEELVWLDRRRRLMGLETVLPLRRYERLRYVSTSSLRLVPSERKKFVANLLPWIVATVNVACYVALDFVVHWFAETLSDYDGINLSLRGSALPRVQIAGDGVASSVLRDIVEAFDPFGGGRGASSVDLTPCLPRPNPPDAKTHVRLGLLLFASLLTMSVGAWLLRLRHVVASIYEPGMAPSRAVWLHRTITVRRTFGLRNLRRNFRWSYLHNPSHLVAGFLDYVYLGRPWLGKLMRLLFGYRPSFCLVCGERFHDGDDDHRPVKCDDDDCKGVYCDECYRLLKNVCPLCTNPVDYGDDVDDASRECDSGDDDCDVGRHGLDSSDDEDDDRYDDDGETEALVPHAAQL